MSNFTRSQLHRGSVRPLNQGPRSTRSGVGGRAPEHPSSPGKNVCDFFPLVNPSLEEMSNFFLTPFECERLRALVMNQPQRSCVTFSHTKPSLLRVAVPRGETVRLKSRLSIQKKKRALRSWGLKPPPCGLQPPLRARSAPRPGGYGGGRPAKKYELPEKV